MTSNAGITHSEAKPKSSGRQPRNESPTRAGTLSRHGKLLSGPNLSILLRNVVSMRAPSVPAGQKSRCPCCRLSLVTFSAVVGRVDLNHRPPGPGPDALPMTTVSNTVGSTSDGQTIVAGGKDRMYWTPAITGDRLGRRRYRWPASINGSHRDYVELHCVTVCPSGGSSVVLGDSEET